MNDGPINRAETWDEFERLMSKIEFIERHQLPNAHLRGGLRMRRRLEAQVERLDLEASRLHSLLFRPLTLDEYENTDPKAFCDYCGSGYRFDLVGPHARFESGGICPRCDPASPGVSPYDPNWHPDKDRR